MMMVLMIMSGADDHDYGDSCGVDDDTEIGHND